MKIKYIVIWLDDGDKYELTPTQERIYSVIKGFSQDGESGYEGGQLELMRAARCKSRTTVANHLSILIDKGLITAEQNVFGNTKYRAVEPMSKNCTPMYNICTTPVSNNCTPYINNNINKDKEINKEKVFVKPSLEEVAAYCRERGNNVNPELFYVHYESNGWMVGRTHMKDWRRAIITWELNNHGQQSSPTISNAVDKMRAKQSANEAAIQLGTTLNLGF